MVENSINNRAIAITQEAIALPADQIVDVALSAHSNSSLRRLTLPQTKNDRSFEVELALSGGNRILWVDQFTGDILHDIRKSDRLMEIVKDVHEGLMAGDRGSYIVELMASWMIVLIITGMFLWWPRKRPFSSVFVLHLAGRSKREKLRQIHGVSGAWIGLMVLLLLLSGLPWTQLWGTGFERFTKLVGWDGPRQEWVITLESSDPHAEHRNDGSNLWEKGSIDNNQVTLESSQPTDNIMPVSIEEIVLTAKNLELGSPVELQPPRGDNGVWTIKSMMQNRPQRLTVHYDKWTGEEIIRIGFKDRHPMQQIVGYGIALHEGALFGWLNQLLGLIAAIGVVALSITGTWMWWRRKPKGTMGIPPMPSDKRIGAGIVCVIGALALFLPMVMISLLIVLIADYFWTRLILQRYCD